MPASSSSLALQRRLLLALALLLAGPDRAAAQDTPETITLEQAIERALAVSPEVARGRAAVRSAEAGERSAFGAYLPDLRLSAGTSRSSTQRLNPDTGTIISGSEDAYSAGLSSAVDLYTGGRRGAERRQAEAETAAAEASLVADRFGAVLAVKQTFYDELRAAELVRAAEERIRRAEEQLSAAERRLGLGSATRSDVLRSQLELTDARVARLEAETGRRAAAHELGRRVGLEGPVAASPVDAPEVRPLALDRAELARLAVESSPAVLAAEAALRSAEALERAARSQYVPTLSLSGGSDWFNDNPALDEGRVSWDVRLGMSYPLFNGFLREETVTRADAAAEAARARAADERRAALADVERLLAALELAEERVELAQSSVTVAEEDLRVQQARYGAGASTILDQITSQVNLAEAEAELVGARYDAQLARAELESLVGRDL